MSAEKWIAVTAGRPCPACGKGDWCSWTSDQRRLKCRRMASPPAGMWLMRAKDGGGVFAFDADREQRHQRPQGSIDFAAAHRAFVAALTTEKLATLSAQLGLPVAAISAIEPGWADQAALRSMKASGKEWRANYPKGAFTFPERDGSGQIVGFSLRTEDGRKGGPSSAIGAKRGVVTSRVEPIGSVPVLIVEGASDVAACAAMGLAAIGRPSNTGGVEMLAELTRGRHVLVVGENDKKDDGKWPGRDGALKVAHELARSRGEAVRWALPPPEVKDVRAFVLQSTETAEALHARGDQFLAHSTKHATIQRPPAGSRQIKKPMLRAEALHGLAGSYARELERYTESDVVAVLAQTLVLFGNAVGRTPYFVVESTRHYFNLDLVLVGDTSRGRKGTSFQRAKALFALADEYWVTTCFVSGLSTGEGLIHQVRDPAQTCSQDGSKGSDPGAADKRAMVIVGEFASVLRVARREGNTLSTVIRDAWDTGDLAILTRGKPEKATGAHISIIGHITAGELQREWSAVDTLNGLGNRILWVHCCRSNLLPNAPPVPTEVVASFVSDLKDRLEFARHTGPMSRDDEANALWDSYYRRCAKIRPGVASDLTARSEAQVLRISCLYALLDRSDVVRVVHLRAAIALHDYVEETVRLVFGDALSDPLADAIWAMLRAAPEGLTVTQICTAFQRNKAAHLVHKALEQLRLLGLARDERRPTSGRPAEVWTAVEEPIEADLSSFSSFPSYPPVSGEAPQEDVAETEAGLPQVEGPTNETKDTNEVHHGDVAVPASGPLSSFTSFLSYPPQPVAPRTADELALSATEADASERPTLSEVENPPGDLSSFTSSGSIVAGHPDDGLAAPDPCGSVTSPTASPSSRGGPSPLWSALAPLGQAGNTSPSGRDVNQGPTKETKETKKGPGVAATTTSATTGSLFDERGSWEVSP